MRKLTEDYFVIYRGFFVSLVFAGVIFMSGMTFVNQLSWERTWATASATSADIGRNADSW